MRVYKTPSIAPPVNQSPSCSTPGTCSTPPHDSSRRDPGFAPSETGQYEPCATSVEAPQPRSPVARIVSLSRPSLVIPSNGETDVKPGFGLLACLVAPKPFSSIPGCSAGTRGPHTPSRTHGTTQGCDGGTRSPDTSSSTPGTVSSAMRTGGSATGLQAELGRVGVGIVEPQSEEGQGIAHQEHEETDGPEPILESYIDSDDELTKEVCETYSQKNPNCKYAEVEEAETEGEFENIDEEIKILNDDNGENSREDFEINSEAGQHYVDDNCLDYRAESVEYNNSYICLSDEGESNLEREEKQDMEEWNEKGVLEERTEEDCMGNLASNEDSLEDRNMNGAAEDRSKKARSEDRNESPSGKLIDQLGVSLIARELRDQRERERELRGRWKEMGLDLPDRSSIDETSFTTYQLAAELPTNNPQISENCHSADGFDGVQISESYNSDAGADGVQAKLSSENCAAISAVCDAAGTDGTDFFENSSTQSESDAVQNTKYNEEYREDYKEEHTDHESNFEPSTTIEIPTKSSQKSIECVTEMETHLENTNMSDKASIEKARAEEISKRVVEELNVNVAADEDIEINRPYLPTNETPIEKEMREFREKEQELRQTRHHNRQSSIEGEPKNGQMCHSKASLSRSTSDEHRNKISRSNSVNEKVAASNSKSIRRSETITSSEVNRSSSSFDASAIASAIGSLRKVPHSILSAEISTKEPVKCQVQLKENLAENCAQIEKNDENNYSLSAMESKANQNGRDESLNCFTDEQEDYRLTSESPKSETMSPFPHSVSKPIISTKPNLTVKPLISESVANQNNHEIGIAESSIANENYARKQIEGSSSYSKQTEGMDESGDLNVCPDALLDAKNKLQKTSNNKLYNLPSEISMKNVLSDNYKCTEKQESRKITKSHSFKGVGPRQTYNTTMDNKDCQSSVNYKMEGVRNFEHLEQDEKNTCNDVILDAKSKLKKTFRRALDKSPSKEDFSNSVSVGIVRCNLSPTENVPKGRVIKQISKFDQSSRSFDTEVAAITMPKLKKVNNLQESPQNKCLDNGIDTITKHQLKKVANNFLQDEMQRANEREQDSNCFDRRVDTITTHKLKKVTNNFLQDELMKDKERELELRTENKSLVNSLTKSGHGLSRNNTFMEMKKAPFQCDEFSLTKTSSNKPLSRSLSQRAPRSAKFVNSQSWIKDNRKSSTTESQDLELLKKFASKSGQNILTSESVKSPAELKIKQELNDLLVRENELRFRQVYI